MSAHSDICLIIEGGYPYLLGGVSSWTDSFIRSFPDRRFSLVSLMASSQPRVSKFQLPDNVVSVTDVLLDECLLGRSASFATSRQIEPVVNRLRTVLTKGDGPEWAALVRELDRTGFGQRALLDSRIAWSTMERIYEEILPGSPLVDFFWAWRFLACSLLSIASAPIPPAHTYHAISTGYAGLLGARAKCATGRPLVITEHGIYTNERRIELSVADWIYDSAAGGFGSDGKVPELRNFWLTAFKNMSRIAYDTADVITTQFRTNQLYQIQDGAPEEKLRIIPNGIEVGRFAHIVPNPTPRRPTVLLVGRVVPIKDIRTFILAAGILKQSVPNLDAIIIGPHDEDHAYASECTGMVRDLGLEDVVRFLGRVPDVKDFFSRVDVIALTSISEAQPLALLEAGAAGLPAVATDVGSCREILEGHDGPGSEGSGGFVVRACDPQGTADALKKILMDPQLRERMGRTMRERVHTVFNQTRIVRLYDELYQSVAFGAPTRATGVGDAPWPA